MIASHLVVSNDAIYEREKQISNENRSVFNSHITPRSLCSECILVNMKLKLILSEDPLQFRGLFQKKPKKKKKKPDKNTATACLSVIFSDVTSHFTLNNLFINAFYLITICKQNQHSFIVTLRLLLEQVALRAKK